MLEVNKRGPRSKENGEAIESKEVVVSHKMFFLIYLEVVEPLLMVRRLLNC